MYIYTIITVLIFITKPLILCDFHGTQTSYNMNDEVPLMFGCKIKYCLLGIYK